MGKGEIPEADTYFILLESGGTIHPPFSFIENMQIITKTLREIHPYEHNPRKNDQAVDAECVAEAVSDYYCNGAKAHANSKAIMAELKRMQG